MSTKNKNPTLRMWGKKQWFCKIFLSDLPASQPDIQPASQPASLPASQPARQSASQAILDDFSPNSANCRGPGGVGKRALISPSKRPRTRSPTFVHRRAKR